MQSSPQSLVDSAFGPSVCRVVEVFARPAATLAAFSGTANATSVPTVLPAVGFRNSMLVSVSDELTWPGNNTANTTGKVYGATYCWAGLVKTPVADDSGLPSQCRACQVDLGERSHGGSALVCEQCEASECPRREWRMLQQAPPPSDTIAALAREVTTRDEAFQARLDTGVDLFLDSRTVDLNDLELEEEIQDGQLYVVDIRGVSMNGRVVDAPSKAFIIDTSPPFTGVVHNALGSEYPEHATCNWCSNDIRVTPNHTYLAASWCCGFEDAQSGISHSLLSFGTEPGSADIVAWRDVGIVEFMEIGMGEFEGEFANGLADGVVAYACIVAVNGAGLHSNVSCSLGVVIDTLPPVMSYVSDGYQGRNDMNYQSMLNVVYGAWEASDSSWISDYFISWGTAPGLQDIVLEFNVNNLTAGGAADEQLLRMPGKAEIVYLNVWAIDAVGHVSDMMTSNGIEVGKGQVVVSRDDTVNGALVIDVVEGLILDIGNVNSSYIAKDEAITLERHPKTGISDQFEDKGVTMGALSIPPEVVADNGNTSIKFVGGRVEDVEIERGTAVDVNLTPLPGNLRYSNYTFTVIAVEVVNETVLETFTTDVPISYYFYFHPDLEGTGFQSEREVQLSLQYFDTECQCWRSTFRSCPPTLRQQSMNYTSSLYIVTAISPNSPFSFKGSPMQSYTSTYTLRTIMLSWDTATFLCLTQQLLLS